MKWAIEHFQTYLLGRFFKVCTDNNLLTYFLTSPNMDAMKQRWINKLAKYDFSLEYQKGKNNIEADALSQIQEEWLSDQEADELLENTPMIPADETIVKIFEEKGCDREPESPAPYAVSLAAMKAIFDNLNFGSWEKVLTGIWYKLTDSQQSGLH